MTTYILAQLTIHDRARYDRYASQFMSVLQGFDGRLLASDESPATVPAIRSLHAWDAG